MWIVYALGAAVIWGMNYAASGRLLERGLSATTLFLFDLLIGVFAVGGFLAATGKLNTVSNEIRALPQSEWIWLAVAAAGTTAAGLLIFMAIGEKNATLASLIEISYPLFVALFAWIFFRDVQLNWPTALGGLLVMAGVFIIYQNNSGPAAH